MSLRQIILCILMTVVIAPARGQNAAGSSIVSRTVLSSDTARVLEQRIYDNGLGDVIQEVQSGITGTLIHSDEEYLVVTRKICIFALYNVNKHSMLRQKQEKSGTGICHVMQGKESKPVPPIHLSLRFTAKEYKKEKQNGHLSCDAPCEHRVPCSRSLII